MNDETNNLIINGPQIVTIHAGKYYVYFHIVNKEVVYVGKGTGIRAFDYRGRSNSWYDAISSDHFDVQIFEWFDTEEEALEREQFIIHKISPKGNSSSLRRYRPKENL